MGRLSNLGSGLASLPPRLKRAPDKQGHDQVAEFWRPWYWTSRWRKLRLAILRRDLFTCQRCGRIEADTAQLVCDHKQPHRGDEALFWDEGNLQTLCAPCHNGAKQRDEKRAGPRRR